MPGAPIVRSRSPSGLTTRQYSLVDAASHDDLGGRLRGLLIGVEDRLPPQTRDLVIELVDASEFGIALETMAEMLCEYDQPVTSSERADFMQLVRRMAMDDRVERNLALCPDRP